MITLEMTILDIVEKYPETESVFREYDSVAGICLLCHKLFDPLDTIAREYGISPDILLEKLNEAATMQ